MHTALEPQGPPSAADVVGRNIRTYRAARGISVTDLARRAEISRRMLTLMEAGQGNASLATIERVADALGVDFATLVEQPTEEPYELIEGDRAALMWSSAAGGRARFFTASRHRGIAELWEWVLEPGGEYRAEADPPGSEELILVVSGRLVVTSPDGDVGARQGDAIRHASDRRYGYRNPGRTVCRFARIVATH